MLFSPSQTITPHTTEYSVLRSDLRSIAQCATASHNALINGTEFQDICIEQNGITSQFICLDAKLKTTKCEIVRNKKPAFSYIVTATSPLDANYYNQMMEVLETYYSDAGTFGLMHDGHIMSGGTATQRVVPSQIISEMELTDGQLVYLTQYEIPDAVSATDAMVITAADVLCPVGTAKTYKFGRWQCVPYNAKTDCGGDMIWDSDLYECVPDESRKPLCADNQNAVIVDSVWECISPFPDKVCPDKYVARLNYNTLEWECVMDPNTTTDTKKCANVLGGAIYGALGATLRVPQTSCTDCERAVTDAETCVTTCVPDPSKLSDRNCYAGRASECSGPNRAFYFGFPSRSYIASVQDVRDIDVPLGGDYSQNRRFNCMECVNGEIDVVRSRPPFTVYCRSYAE